MALTKVTGQVIKNTTDVTVGVLTVTNTLAVGGTVSIGGTLTYEDVTNVDAVGLITARNGIVVGSGITLSKDGDIFATGVTTSTTFSGAFSGSGANITAINASNLGSGTVPTARLGSGTASSSTFLRGDSTFQTVNTDLVSDTSPQLGGNLDSNGANILFSDSSSAGTNLNRLKFGTGTDLHIWHNGSTGNSNISAYSGDLYIQGNNGSGTGVNQIAVKSNAAVELNYQGTKKFETTSYGVLSAAQVRVAASNASTVAFSVGDAGTGFYNTGSNTIGYSANGTQKWNINSSGELILQDSVKIKFGTSSDAEIYHDTADTYFKNSTGTLYFRSDTISLNALSTTDTYLSATNGGGVSLRHDNSEKLNTSSSGVNIEGQIVIDHTAGTDGKGEIAFGESGRPFIDGFDNGNHGSGAGFDFRAGNGHYFIKTRQGSSVDLYHNNSVKLATSSSGCTLQGTLTTQGTGYGSGSSNLELQPYGQRGYINWTGTDTFYFRTGSSYTTRWFIDSSGHFMPGTNNTYDLGSSSYRWRNIYTNDLNLSNKGSTNSVDNTWGDYTIQEGESDLFLINNRSGKKFKFMLQEVS